MDVLMRQYYLMITDNAKGTTLSRQDKNQIFKKGFEN